MNINILKKSLPVLFLLLFFQFSFAELHWKKTADVPDFMRINHAVVAFHDNQGNPALFVIGGEETSSNGYGNNDVWRSLDGITWTRIIEHAAFPPRLSHSVFVKDDKIWIVGGNDKRVPPITYLKDVWYSSDGVNWTSANATWSNPGGPDFSGREGHSTVVVNNEVWLIGGSDANKDYNDIWKSSNGINWTKYVPSASSTIFPARTYHGSVFFDNKTWVIGGNDFKDVWSSSTGGQSWDTHPDYSSTESMDSRNAFKFDNTMWIVDAQNHGTDPLKVHSFNNNGVWQEIPSLAFNQQYVSHAAAVFKGKVWIIGGYFSDEVLSSVDMKHLTINAPHGSVSPNATDYEVNSSVTLTATPDPGYTFAGWGDAGSGTTNPITITMDADKIITAHFQANPHKISVTSTGQGIVFPVGNGHVATVDYGANISFAFLSDTKITYPAALATFTQNFGEGYVLKSYPMDGAPQQGVLVDGIPQPVVDGSSPGFKSITFSNVVADHTLLAEFVLKTVPVTVTVTGHGSASPTGVVQVPFGSNQIFSINSDAGYDLDKVIVDKGLTTESDFSNLDEDYFTLEKVKTAKTVEFVFADCSIPNITPNFITVKSFSSDGDAHPVVSHVVPDGFGRTVQTQQEMNSSQILVSGVYTNCAGLPIKEVKPFVSATTGGFSFVPMHCQTLIQRANNYFDGTGGKPDAQGFAFSEMRYRDDPTFKRKENGEPGLSFSLAPTTGHHNKVWDFGVADANATSFLSAEDLDESSLDEREKASIENENAGTQFKYYLTVTKDPNDQYSQSISDQFGNVQKKWSSSELDGGHTLVDKYEYDALNRLSKEIPPLGDAYASTYERNSLGEVTSDFAPDRGQIQYRYDKGGRLKFVKDARQAARDIDDATINHYQILDYDENGRLIAISENNNSHSFDQPDLPVTGSKIPKSVAIYDKVDGDFLKSLHTSASAQEVDKILQESSFKPGLLAATISYDESGNHNVVDVFSYDNRDFVVSQYHLSTEIPVQKFAMTYNIQGVVNEEEYYNGISNGQWNFEDLISYEYDDLGRFSKIKHDGFDLAKYKYNERGQLIKEDLFASASSTATDGLNYAFNIRDWPSSIVSNGASPVFSQILNYDGRFDGSIATKSLNYHFSDAENKIITNGYGYDGLNRLVSVSSTDNDLKSNYSFDDLGRLSSKKEGDINYASYAYQPGTSRLISVPGDPGKSNSQNYVYDPNGNLVLDRSKKLTIDYDWRNMPFKIHFYNEIPSGNLSWRDVENNKLATINAKVELGTIEFRYDASGQRVLKDAQLGGQRSVSAYVDDYAVFEGTDQSHLTLQYLNLVTPFGLRGKKDVQTGKKNIYLTDNMGSISAIEKDDGTVTEGYAYQPYGSIRNLRVTPTVGDASREKHVGKELDEELGLNWYYYGARYLDPDLGIWTTTDPMEQFHNGYSYVGGDPINYSDLWGFEDVNLNNKDVHGYDPYESMNAWIDAHNWNGISDVPAPPESKPSYTSEFMKIDVELKDPEVPVKPGLGALDLAKKGLDKVSDTWDAINDKLDPFKTLPDALDKAENGGFRDKNGKLDKAGVAKAGIVVVVGVLAAADKEGGKPKKGIQKLERFEGKKPTYFVNPAHVEGPTFVKGKTPLPPDAEEVYKTAVPGDPKNPKNWWGKNSKGQIYRYSVGNDGTAHFSGIDGVGDGTKNLAGNKYAKGRLKELK